MPLKCDDSSLLLPPPPTFATTRDADTRRRAPEPGRLRLHETLAVSTGWQNGVVDVPRRRRGSRSAEELSGANGLTQAGAGRASTEVFYQEIHRNYYYITH